MADACRKVAEAVKAAEDELEVAKKEGPRLSNGATLREFWTIIGWKRYDF